MRSDMVFPKGWRDLSHDERRILGEELGIYGHTELGIGFFRSLVKIVERLKKLEQPHGSVDNH